MYQTIAMTSEVRERLPEVHVLAVKLKLKPLNEAPSSILFEEDWHRLHQQWKNSTKSDVANQEKLMAYQQFYRDQLGLNIKKTPPSVQNLIQRYLIKDTLERLPVIHPIVDAVNVAAVSHLIPLGVFDAQCVEGEVQLALSHGGEEFQPLGSSTLESLPPHMLILADEVKVLSQFCYRDCEAQKITENTQEVWLLGCQVSGISVQTVEAALEEAQFQLKRIYSISNS